MLLFVTSCSEHSKTSYAKPEQQLEDSQIINIMMTVDKGEIAASQEALKKELNPAVDVYAKFLIQQHQNNLDMLKQFAKQNGLDPKDSAISNSLEADGKKDLKNISELQGKDFNKAFIDAMVKGHQDGLQLIDTKLIPQTRNPQLKAVVGQFRSMVADHLEKAQKIQRNLS